MQGMDAGAQIVLLVLGVGLLLLLASTVTSSVQKAHQRTDARLAALERKVDAVVDHLGVVVPEPRYPEVERLLAQGQQVAAIRAYRQATGADLLTARDAVDELARGR